MTRKDRVVKVTSEVCGIPEEIIKMETSFTGDLSLDPSTMKELIKGFEEEFNMEIPDDEVDILNTVKDVVEFAKNYGDWY